MDIEVEIVNVRAVAIGKVISPSMPAGEMGDADASLAIIDPDHQAFFDGEFCTTPLYNRSQLRPGNRIVGPAIVIQKDSTTLVLPGFEATVDAYTNLIIAKA